MDGYIKKYIYGRLDGQKKYMKKNIDGWMDKKITKIDGWWMDRKNGKNRWMVGWI